jgi:predicted aldo/keto reductase-like oxidoreductase
MPCPKGITLNWCVRMPQAIRRMPTANFFSEQWQADMEKTKNCREARGLKCGLCKSRCPYGLDVPAILPKNYADYREQVAQH